ncbi:MAG: hypothetical protein K1X83_02765 [Oligoflexia bacterium]|nr:hypothetical protein [Oligoflexia bacterium]
MSASEIAVLLDNAKLEIQAHRFTEALQLLDQAGRLSSTPVREREFLRGLCLSSLQRAKEALAAFEREYEHFPLHPQAKEMILDARTAYIRQLYDKIMPLDSKLIEAETAKLICGLQETVMLWEAGDSDEALRSCMRVFAEALPVPGAFELFINAIKRRR